MTWREWLPRRVCSRVGAARPRTPQLSLAGWATAVCGATPRRGHRRPPDDDGGRNRHQRGRRHLHRQQHRGGLPRRGSGDAESGGALARYFEDGLEAALDALGSSDSDAEMAELVRSVHRIMARSDEVRRLRVRANADTPEDAARAPDGRRGIGLLRTEHMFLGERRELVERLILASEDSERNAALDALLPLQRKDFIRILEQMDGLPVTIRLIDPAAARVPPRSHRTCRAGCACGGARREIESDLRLLQAVNRLNESNPMLGLRGVRLGLVLPGLLHFRCVRSPRRPVSASGWVAIHGPRSWCHSWVRFRARTGHR